MAISLTDSTLNVSLGAPMAILWLIQLHMFLWRWFHSADQLWRFLLPPWWRFHEFLMPSSFTWSGKLKISIILRNWSGLLSFCQRSVIFLLLCKTVTQNGKYSVNKCRFWLFQQIWPSKSKNWIDNWEIRLGKSKENQYNWRVETITIFLANLFSKTKKCNLSQNLVQGRWLKSW